MKQYPPLILWFMLVSAFFLSVAQAQAVDTTAPAFRLADADGQPLALADVIGEPLVLNVWATWCPPCREELPLFEQAQTALADEVTFLLVNNNEAAEAAAQFLAQEGITLLAAFEPTRAQRNTFNLNTTREVVRDYRVRGMPTTFFIAADGVIQAVRVGEVGQAELTELLATIGVYWQQEAISDTSHYDTETHDVESDNFQNNVENNEAETNVTFSSTPELTVLGELHGRISSLERQSALACGDYCNSDSQPHNTQNKETQQEEDKR